MASPIASPQNAIAIGNTVEPKISWPVWLGVAVPICILSDVICWLLLIFVYRPAQSTPFIQPLRKSETKFTKKQYFILAVTGMTILLFILESIIKQYIGKFFNLV